MYDKNDPPEVKAALLAAVLAAIALHTELGLAAGHTPDPLPESVPDTDAANTWRQAMAELARVTDVDTLRVENAVRHSLYVYFVHAEQVHEDMERGCPDHLEVHDLCHGDFGELALPFMVYMGMTRQEFLAYLVKIHQEQRPECPGFTATEAALAGCTTQGRGDRLVPWH